MDVAVTLSGYVSTISGDGGVNRFSVLAYGDDKAARAAFDGRGGDDMLTGGAGGLRQLRGAGGDRECHPRPGRRYRARRRLGEPDRGRRRGRRYRGRAGDQAFAWIGSTAFSGSAGQLCAYEQNGTWFVEGDTVADLVIALTLQGPTPLGAGDFLP